MWKGPWSGQCVELVLHMGSSSAEVLKRFGMRSVRVCEKDLLKVVSAVAS